MGHRPSPDVGGAGGPLATKGSRVLVQVLHPPWDVALEGAGGRLAKAGSAGRGGRVEARVRARVGDQATTPIERPGQGPQLFDLRLGGGEHYRRTARLLRQRGALHQELNHPTEDGDEQRERHKDLEQ